MALILIVCGVLMLSATTIAFLLSRSNRKLGQAREALAQSQERLSLTLHASGVAVWSWDIATSTITPDENCSAVFGLPPGQFVNTGEEFAALLHPDDRERVLQETAASIEGGADYNTDFRVVVQDGVLRYLSVRGKAIVVKADGHTGLPVSLGT
jgi:PAS domain-containing protein